MSTDDKVIFHGSRSQRFIQAPITRLRYCIRQCIRWIRGFIIGHRTSPEIKSQGACPSSYATTGVQVAREVPEETSTVEVEIYVAGQVLSETTRVQILPMWVIIEDPEEEEFKPEVVANYRRIVDHFIQLFELHESHLRVGEFFDYIQERASLPD